VGPQIIQWHELLLGSLGRAHSVKVSLLGLMSRRTAQKTRQEQIHTTLEQDAKNYVQRNQKKRPSPKGKVTNM